MTGKPQDGGGIAWNNYNPGKSQTPFDKWKVPDGRNVSTVENGELNSILCRMGIAGINANNGRHDNLKIYDAYLQSISDAAGAAAVAAYLASKA